MNIKSKILKSLKANKKELIDIINQELDKIDLLSFEDIKEDLRI